MEKYLKMPAGFDGGAEWFGNAMRDDMTASDVLIDAAVHAINSHDELVAMNKELLAALDGVLAIVGDSGGVAGYHLNGDIADWGEFDEINAVYAAIEKAKAAS